MYFLFGSFIYCFFQLNILYLRTLFKAEKMINRIISLTAVILLAFTFNSCKMIGGKNGSGGAYPNDGQLHGVPQSKTWTTTRPYGMVYVPSGMFHMGPSDEDINYSYTATNKAVSISGFWMDATEITNNEYKQFTNWVRDSIAAKLLGYVK